ncbi:MmoB/DmpM family protein [Bacillus benzoevorans]|uniref:Phenol hydroxylase P2 protein n=1 Tax=Bacillus benzoevorans TaxID=1456 RepID=A0A7X0LVB8_9BACI|nr:MmoB/DmpM family protein [Bacillus benzoevorans]MBB6444134.1 phenol hydroxylase P2 protein [Bacillus benzoevorans]
MSEKQAYVGMDLDTSMGNITDALIAAIEEDNEGVIVEDFAVYKKVKAPGKMVVNRETVEEHLGADFDMDRVHMAMSSCFGFIKDWDEEQLIIQWDEEE